MSRRHSGGPAALALAALLLGGCGVAGDATIEARAATARARAQSTWRIRLEDGGSRHDLKLDRMDIFLVEDETAPEVYEIHGPDAVLVGMLPADLHVGYEAAYERAVGRTLPIHPTGGDPGELKASWVQLGDMRVPVSGGSLTIEKVTGKWEGSEGDRTYWGTLELRVQDGGAGRTLRGKFAVNCVTWG